jgi:DNA polymerase IV
MFGGNLPQNRALLLPVEASERQREIVLTFSRHRRRHVKAVIREELSLTASAGVAPNKFLAKLASDWRKPDGLFVIQPEDVDSFLLPLPIGRLPGVGKVTGDKLAKLGIQTVGDLRKLELSPLEKQFGRYGLRLHELARGVDDTAVVPDRPTKSISVEDTFGQDILLAETEPMIRRLAEKLWSASRKESRLAGTVVLKLKTREFKILTRSYTPDCPPSSCEQLTDIVLQLRKKVDLGPNERYRLVGVGLSNFRDAEKTAAQPPLFE